MDALKTIFELLKLVKPYSFHLIGATLNGTLGFILAMNITIFASFGIVKFLGVPIELSYSSIFIIISLSGALRGGMRYIEQYFNHDLAFRILALLRKKVFSALRKLPLEAFDQKNKGELLSMIQGDIESIEVFYAHTITPVGIALLTSLCVIIFLVCIDPIYALIACIAFGLIGFVLPIFFYLSNSSLAYQYRNLLAQTQEYYLQSVYGCYEVIFQQKSQQRLQNIISQTQELNHTNQALEIKNVFFKNATQTLIVLFNTALLVCGYSISPDSFWSFVGFATLSSSFGSVVALASLPQNLSISLASGKRLLALLQTPTPQQKELTPVEKFQTLHICNLSFGYGNKSVLQEINLSLEKGEIIGICGKSGSGKSTLLKLLMRFYTPQKGEILFNSLPLHSLALTPSDLALFSQETYLFADTIANNLKIAKVLASEEEMLQACKQASIDEYILSLPQGLSTPITDLQDNLSSGEKQRLGLARIFLANPQILLLDEATANIDAINEALILKAIKAHANSAIIVSHRPSTLSICHKIYELQEGRLINL